MKKDDLVMKKVSEELGIDFNEAVELFSEETLNSMNIENVVGGASVDANIDCWLSCVPVNPGNNCSCNSVCNKCS